MNGLLFRCLLAGLLAAGIAHLATVLALSDDLRSSAAAHLKVVAGGALLRTVPLPVDDRGPFGDPAMAAAFCLFDLDAGPVEAVFPADALDVAVVSVHNARGQAVYALTSRSALHGTIDLAIARPDKSGATGSDDDETVLHVPFAGRHGFVLVQALASLPGERPGAEKAAGALTCRTGRPT